MKKTISIHALQYQPNGCMNRGEANEIKTTEMGGVTRVYVSSQSWKKAMRDYAKNKKSDFVDSGLRTKHLSRYMTVLREAGYTEEDVTTLVEYVFGKLLKLSTNIKNTTKSSKNKKNTAEESEEDGSATLKNLFAYKESDLVVLAEMTKKYAKDLLTLAKTDSKKITDDLKILQDTYSAEFTDVLKGLSEDVILFGRLVPNNQVLNVESPCSFSIAHGVSEADITTDYFTAVDEEEGVQGSGMLGYKEMSNGILYRYGQINCSILEANLKQALNKNENDDINDLIAQEVERFIDAFLNAIPSGMQKTYATITKPYFAYITISDGQDMCMSSAFLKPIPVEEENEEHVQKVFEEYVKNKYKTILEKPEKAFVIGESDLGESVHLKKAGEAVCQYLSSNV